MEALARVVVDQAVADQIRAVLAAAAELPASADLVAAVHHEGSPSRPGRAAGHEIEVRVEARPTLSSRKAREEAAVRADHGAPADRRIGDRQLLDDPDLGQRIDLRAAPGAWHRHPEDAGRPASPGQARSGNRRPCSISAAAARIWGANARAASRISAPVRLSELAIGSPVALGAMNRPYSGHRRARSSRPPSARGTCQADRWRCSCGQQSSRPGSGLLVCQGVARS